MVFCTCRVEIYRRSRMQRVLGTVDKLELVLTLDETHEISIRDIVIKQTTWKILSCR